MLKTVRYKHVKISNILFLLGFLLLLAALFATGCSKSPQSARKLPEKPTASFQPPQKSSVSELELWNKLVKEKRNSPVSEKLASVNKFFNGFEFIEDRHLWGKEDYWATLGETLKSRGGDCEDFTIAKYFTLRNLNIPEESLRITYVISLKTNKPHMVLACQINPYQEPVILDTLNNYLFTASQRPDLVPVYSFNGEGYWLAQKDKSWSGERVGSAARISLWWELLERMRLAEKQFSGT